MPRIAIIADDLTGAFDAAAPFAAQGLATVVATAPGHLAAALAAGPEVVAVSTDSREVAEAQAVAAVRRAVAGLGGAAIWFKKVDSRLKGHVRAETLALAEAAGLGSVLLCPAIPGFGRIVAGGRLSGFGIAAPIDGAALVAGSAIRLADAASEADLDRLAAEAEAGVLLAGARGLAAALARRQGPGAGEAAGRLEAPVAIAVGSRDPITVAQVRRLAAARPEVAVIAAPDGDFAGVAPAAAVVLLQSAPGAAAAPAAVERAFARSFVPAFTEGRRTLILTGGATAAAVLERLGVGVLGIRWEAAPGMPVSRAVGVRPPLDVVTKSGGFGGVEALVDLVGRVAGVVGAEG